MTINANAWKNIPPEAQVVPASRAVAITASATAFDPTRALHISTDETIVVDFADGGTGISLTVVAGQVYPYRVVKVTTGTAVVALY